MLTESLHPIFQGAAEDAVAGQLASLIVRFCNPNVMLKLLSYWTDARLMTLMMLAFAEAVELKTAV
jgi:hypothetical protein